LPFIIDTRNHVWYEFREIKSRHEKSVTSRNMNSNKNTHVEMKAEIFSC